MEYTYDDEYDIWKIKEQYYVRVRKDGQVTPVSVEVVRELWKGEYQGKKEKIYTSRVCSFDEARDIIDQHDAYAAVENRLCIQEFTESLTERQQQVILLHFNLELSVEECALYMGISEGRIYAIINDIKNKKNKKNFFE